MAGTASAEYGRKPAPPCTPLNNPRTSAARFLLLTRSAKQCDPKARRCPSDLYLSCVWPRWAVTVVTQVVGNVSLVVVVKGVNALVLHELVLCHYE